MLSPPSGWNEWSGLEFCDGPMHASLVVWSGICPQAVHGASLVTQCRPGQVSMQLPNLAECAETLLLQLQLCAMGTLGG